MDIRHLTHEQIDKTQWDFVIESSPNSVIYAYSWFLDSLCVGWEALVVGDYEIIMPIPIKRMFGLKLAYKPLYIQRLGVFSIQRINSEKTFAFLEATLKHFHYVTYSLALDNIDSIPKQFSIHQRKNYTLDLSNSYELISANYAKDARRSLKNNVGISWVIEKDYESVISNFAACYGNLFQMKDKNTNLFRAAIAKADAHERLIGFSVFRDNQKIASALFFICNETVFYLLGAPTPEHKKQNATHFLIDEFIRQYAQKFETLDFEGSDIPSVAYFYQKWGSRNEGYFQLVGTRSSLLAKLFEWKNYLRSKI